MQEKEGVRKHSQDGDDSGPGPSSVLRGIEPVSCQFNVWETKQVEPGSDGAPRGRQVQQQQQESHMTITLHNHPAVMCGVAH